ncbi:MAG TPA: phospholipid carrier-dependent glycosyltransferase [Actinomycetota bacterium]
MPGLLQVLNRPVYAVLAVAAIAAALRFAGLGSPPERVFDEFYYPKAACILLGDSNKACDVTSENERYWRRQQWDVGSWVHPPLGKWMIAMGERAFGVDSPFGWRFSSAVAGTLVCVMIALIAQVLWGQPLWTFVAGLLAAVDSLEFVLSRLSLLDIFVAFWVVLGFLCLVLDHRWIERRTAPGDGDAPARPDAETAPTPERPRRRVPSPVWRPWRFAAGVAFGGAASVKWSGAFALVGAVLLTLAWETTRRRRAERGGVRAFGETVLWEGFGMGLCFVLVPAAVYVATWLPWIHHFDWDFSYWWFDNQVAAWHYHRDLQWTALDVATHTYTPTHPYYSRAWTWLIPTRPVSMFAHRTGDTQVEILAIGNPAIMWGSAFALPYLAYAWRRKRDWGAGLVLVAALTTWLPWFVFSRPQFFFYMAPVTPFLALAGAYLARDLSDMRLILTDRETGTLIESRRHPYRPIAWVYLALAVGLFIWFFPVLTGEAISLGHWRLIVWFRGWI